MGMCVTLPSYSTGIAASRQEMLERGVFAQAPAQVGSKGKSQGALEGASTRIKHLDGAHGVSKP